MTYNPLKMSKKILLIYSSVDGHTLKICKHMMAKNKSLATMNIHSLETVTPKDLDSNEIIVIGASIRYGNHRKELYSFINKNVAVLDEKNSYFFSVNAVARKIEKRSPEVNTYIKKFKKSVKWSPKKIKVFPGKIDYPKYGFFDKHMVRLIMYFSGGPTDLSKSYEFTDWKEVDRFADEIIESDI